MICHISRLPWPDTLCPPQCLGFTGTDVGPAHYWSQGPLVNGVRNWQLIIKHDLTHRFHGRTLGVRPSVRVTHWLLHECGTSPLLEPGSIREWCQKLAVDYKT